MAQCVEEFHGCGGLGDRLPPPTVRFFGDGGAQQQSAKARLEPCGVRGRENRWVSNVFPESPMVVER